jgi:tRNA-specific 2-thiouridylase
MTKIREAVAMSGGVDSSVAALLRVRAGAEVVGLTMQLWDSDCADAGTKACCGLEHALDARNVCKALGASHKLLDLREEFKAQVVDVFVREYLAGRTPNPCVRCNTFMKWDVLWAKAEELGCQKLSTGHYANIVEGPYGHELRRGADLAKDQSYFLWGIPRHLLSKTMFPLADLPKSDTRQLALDAELPTAKKSESQDICFVPGGDYRELVRKQSGEDRPPLLEPGPIVDALGNPMGTHQGLACYTIGQRRGVGVASTAPLYVIGIEPQTNTLRLGVQDDLLVDHLVLEQENWLLHDTEVLPEELEVQVRYRSRAIPAKVVRHESGTEIILQEPSLAPANGQSMVIYHQDRVIGGGILSKSDRLRLTPTEPGK